MSNEVSIFEKASRMKLTFDSVKGQIGVEDLWDLPLTHATKENLDDIAKALYAKIKESEVVSFVAESNTADEKLKLKFEIVKYIIDVLKRERDEARQAAFKRSELAKLQDLRDRKQNAELENLSIEEIEARIASLS